MNRPEIPFLFAVLLLALSLACHGEVLTSEDPDTGLLSWKWQHQGVSLELVQRLPDQTRAFFQGRGFSVEDADIIAASCVFQSIFRNDGKKHLSYDLNDWEVNSEHKKKPLITAERWEQKWQDTDVTEAARIALRWSLLPTRQEYEPGDYNWGMSSYGLAPGERFDLVIVVKENGDQVKVRINGIECAKDR